MGFDLSDHPIESLKFDLLDTRKYATAISEFILQSSPPVTISIQGEWGSGKTSLMKMIEANVSNSSKPKEVDQYYESIWINTWEFFVNNNSNNACEQIILYILREITKHRNNDGENVQSSLKNLKQNIRHYFSSIANITMDVVGVSSETKQETIDIFSDYRLTTVSKLRRSIAETVEHLVQNKNGLSDKGFVFFIDDLDRIEPENAIRILEILKNLFDINHCVFVLALDYDVVVRGLQEKYGDFDEKSEMNYRAYFDKLVQLPFSMPIESFDPTKMIKRSFNKIGYFKENQVDDRMYQKLAKVVKQTINNNPRSWKRVVNSLLLSDILDQGNKNILKENRDNRMINFAFVLIQIGYPKVYSHILSSPVSFEEYLEDNNQAYFEELHERFEQYLGKERLQHVEFVFNTLKELADDFSDIHDVILISATTNVEADMGPTLQYDGNLYNQSSQTQFKQGNYLIKRTNVKPESKVLDIGCGNGLTTIELHGLEPTAKIDAFDFSDTQIDVARLNQVEKNVPSKAINFYQKDALTLVDQEKYDLIFSNAALHWLTDGKKMYQKIYDALKSQGSIAIHQGGKDSYKELHETVLKAAADLGIDSYFSGWEFPVFYPTRVEMARMLLDIGFKNVEVISKKPKSIEYDNLAENFANASLLPYQERCKTDQERDNLKKKFMSLANEEINDVKTHRLYIFADKE